MEWFWFALISAIFSAVAAIYEKKSLQKEKPATFCIIFAMLTLLISLVFLPRVNFNLGFLTISIIILKSLISGLAFFLVIYSLKHLEISSALPLMVLTPGIVAIAAFIFLGETLTQLQILGLVMLIIGTYILPLKNKSILNSFKELKKSKGHFAIGIALILFTISAILDKIILTKYQTDSLTYMVFYFLFISILFSIIFLFTNQKKNLIPSIKRSYKFILIVALSTIIFRYTQFIAIRNSSSIALVISLKRISVFFATLIGGKLFNETNLLRKLIAVIIMLIGATLIVI